MGGTVKKSIPRGIAFAALASLMMILNAGAARAQWTTSGTNTTTTNNVGIGTTAPATPLELRVPSGDVITRFTNTDAGGALDLRYKFELGQHRMGLTDANGQWMFYTRYAASNANSVGFFPGRVGVGTETPGYPLTVRANTNLAPLNLIGGTGNIEIWKDANPQPSKAVAFGSAVPGNAAGDDIQLSTYSGSAWTSRLTVSNSTGNVGVGTSNPGYHLHVSNNLNSEVLGAVENVNAGATAAASIIAKTNDGYAYLKMGSTAYGSWGAVGTTGTGSFYYDVFNGAGDHVWRTTAAASERMRLTNAGNVGIGTTAPAAKLHVAGDIRVDGNINAKYQDVAEWVPTLQALSAGTVVVLDTEHSNHVLASTTSYDVRVAGVISARPGIALGEAGEGKALVATTGRVKVKVDASRAAVRIGDLLVTSDVPGVAMKSEPISVGGRQMHAPGTIIGKALEPLERGTGEILVLLSLQ
jgi:hypothetical protein